MDDDLKAMRDQIRRLERRYLITMVLVIATFVSYRLKYQSAMNDINQMVEITNQATKEAIQVNAQTSALCQEVLDNLEILHLELHTKEGVSDGKY